MRNRVSSTRAFRAGISYRVYGGLRFSNVRKSNTHWRIALGRQPDDDGAFSRVVNVPPRGIGARSIEQVQELAQRYNFRFTRRQRPDQRAI